MAKTTPTRRRFKKENKKVVWKPLTFLSPPWRHTCRSSWSPSSCPGEAVVPQKWSAVRPAPTVCPSETAPCPHINTPVIRKSSLTEGDYTKAPLPNYRKISANLRKWMQNLEEKTIFYALLKHSVMWVSPCYKADDKTEWIMLPIQ